MLTKKNYKISKKQRHKRNPNIQNFHKLLSKIKINFHNNKKKYKNPKQEYKK